MKSEGGTNSALNAYTSAFETPLAGPLVFFSNYLSLSFHTDLKLGEEERRQHLLQQRVVHVHSPPHLFPGELLVSLEEQQHDRLQRQHLQRDASLVQRHLQLDEAAHEGPAERALGIDGERVEGLHERLEDFRETNGGGLVEIFELGLGQRRPDALREDVESEEKGLAEVLLVELATELSG